MSNQTLEMVTDFVFVRVKSHRAGHKLKAKIGELHWHYTWKDGGTFVKITTAQLPTALEITGICRARGNDFSPCVSWK